LWCPSSVQGLQCCNCTFVLALPLDGIVTCHRVLMVVGVMSLPHGPPSNALDVSRKLKAGGY
jgi:hypothetical protein